MIRLAMTLFKLALISIVVLVLGQISIGNQRICDHVRDVVQHTHVQGPIQWVARHFNFTHGYHAQAGAGEVWKETSKAGRAEVRFSRKTSSAASPEHSKSDKSRLSGLLKR